MNARKIVQAMVAIDIDHIFLLGDPFSHTLLTAIKLDDPTASFTYVLDLIQVKTSEDGNSADLKSSYTNLFFGKIQFLLISQNSVCNVCGI